MEQLPQLQAEVCRLRFIPVCERYIEGEHSKVHKLLAGLPRSGPRHVAWPVTRKPIMKGLVAPERLQCLASSCDKVRNVALALQHFGFAKHPVVRRSLANHETWRESIKKDGAELAKVLLRCDDETVFTKIEVLRCEAESFPATVRGEPAPLPAGSANSAQHVLREGAALGAKLEPLFVAEAVRHFRSMASELGAHKVYCLRGPGVVKGMPSSIRTLDDLGRQDPIAVHGARAVPFHFESEAGMFEPHVAQAEVPQEQAPRLPRVSHLCFFTVVSWQPANKRTMRRTLPRETLCIAVHEQASVDPVSRNVRLHLENPDGTSLRPVMVNFGALGGAELGSLTMWDTTNIFCQLPAVAAQQPPPLEEADLQKALLALTKAGALPGSPLSYSHVDAGDPSDVPLEVLEQLHVSNVVEKVAEPEDGSSCWRLTSEGLRSLQVGLEVSGLKSVLIAPAALPDDLDTLSTWQCLTLLKVRGWKAVVLTRGVSPPAFVHGEEGEKHWYVKASAKQLVREYLLCLLAAHEGKLLQPVPHKLPRAAYKALFAGEEWHPKPRRRRATFNFVAMADAPMWQAAPPPARRARNREEVASMAESSSSSSSSCSSSSSSASSSGGSSSNEGDVAADHAVAATDPGIDGAELLEQAPPEGCWASQDSL